MRIITDKDIIDARRRVAENEAKGEQQNFEDALLASSDLTPEMVNEWTGALVNVYWCDCPKIEGREAQIACDFCGLPPYWKSVVKNEPET